MQYHVLPEGYKHYILRLTRDFVMFSDELEKLRREGLLRRIKDREPLAGGLSAGSPVICIGSRDYINFASNDYLGLAGDASIIEAAARAMALYGFGSGSSRLLAGGTALHAELEQAVASFKGTEAALVFNSGYTANVSAIPALAREGDLLLSDELNHASIIDGCRLSKARTVIYRHGDTGQLADILERERARRKIVVTDTVFSMDGDIAPVRALHDICLRRRREDDILLYLDDAHGTGVLGGGKGALAHSGIAPEGWIVQMGTFSKALGSYGAFIAASREIVDWLTNTARGFIYSTALPACAVAASLAALDIVRGNSGHIERLWSNRERLWNDIRALGLDTLNSATPIIPIAAGDVDRAVRLSEMLWERSLYAPAIRPPTVKIPRIRVSATAAHTEEDIDKLIEALAAYYRRHRP